MRHTTLRAGLAALVAIPLIGLGLGSPAGAATAAPVCNLPTVVSSAPIISSTTGVQIATVQLRKATVSIFLGHSYYRYCTRVYLSKAYASTVTGTATVRVQAVKNGPWVDSSTTGTLTYVAPTSPAYATAGLSSPIVDVTKGSVGYSARVSIAPPGN